MAIPTDEQSSSGTLENAVENNQVQAAEPVEETPTDEIDVEGDVTEKEPAEGVKEKSKTLPPKEQSKVEQRIGKLTKQRTEAREAFLAAVEENRILREQLAKALPPKETYESEERYLVDVVERGMAKKAVQHVQEKAVEAQNQYQRVLVEEWAGKEAAAVAELPDYHEVVTKSTLPVSAHVQEVIMDSPVGAHIAYELGKNPEELLLLNKLSPREVDRAVARMEARIMYAQQTKPAAPAAPVRQETPPAATPKSSGVPATPKVRNLEELSGDAYLKAYKEMQAAKRAAAQRR